jgi:hypothetical protein
MLLSALGRFGPNTRSIQWAIAAVVPLSFLAYLTFQHSSVVPLSVFFSDATHLRNVEACALVAFTSGALATTSVLLVWKRTDPFNPSISGAVLGLVGGLAGALSVGLVCPHDEGWHLWLGHGLSVIVMLALGAGVGRRLLSP